MTENKHNVKIKKGIVPKDNQDVMMLVYKKIQFFADVIQKTIVHVQKNKVFDLLGIVEVNTCVERLMTINKQINSISESTYKNPHPDDLINYLQNINNELSSLLKTYGTESLDDLLLICFGNNNKFTETDDEQNKFEILKKYFHPTGYKIVTKKEDGKTKKGSDETIDEHTKNFECFDILSSYKQFHMRVYGLKVYIYNSTLKKGLVVYGILDDVIVDLLNSPYMIRHKKDIKENLPAEPEFQDDTFDNFLKSLSLKDYMINSICSDVYNKFIGYLSQNKAIHQKQISTVVKDFITDDLFLKRNTLIYLLIKSSSHENQYLAYLLYDLLSNETNGGGDIDTKEQMLLFDSFTWYTKQFFKQAMKKTIQYTNDLSNFDINKIPLEQQICLMNVPDSVKEKAMMKLKEVKSKSDDSGSKARQYLDGLLKIPFGVYKREPILNIMGTVKKQFLDFCKNYNIEDKFPEIPIKDNYTSVEIFKYLKYITNFDTIIFNDLDNLVKSIQGMNKQAVAGIVNKVNCIIGKYNMSTIKLTLKRAVQVNEMTNFFNTTCRKPEYSGLLKEVHTIFCNTNIHRDIEIIQANITKITEYTTTVASTLDKAVYGHKKAKQQIECIIGQWINTSSNNTCGHVLGFEGNPGVGKTTLAKGLANCLIDENGQPRPLALLAVGGDSNASTLVGHSFTYVGSTWGRLVQILIDNKCMNPIIVIDEPDKISKTEHGKEIAGIFTHLLDPSQNSEFQDKYFVGINFDFSQVLFVLSYNDPRSIDKIVLDRVHRIKFDSLTLDDKLVISKKHLLPEIYTNIGLEGMIHFPDETLKLIIKDYTLEPGVRKLKEALFEIVGQLNLNILKNTSIELELPVVITPDDVKKKYFKEKREIIPYKIHNVSRVGVINALWANDLDDGGVLELQASFIPSSQFLGLTLTGSLGDVMKQSVSVSLTNAWNLTPVERQQELIKMFNNPKENSVFGIHINCPDISTNKDGPSATTAFTVVIYSLFNNIKIKNYVGITGETSFDYILTEIGGLEHKIIKSIPSGVTEFIFPEKNRRDFDKIMDKYSNNEIINGIKFHCVNNIQTVFDLIFENPPLKIHL
jgi:ATP-dependent Lon protease